jgi:hypothetical protein
VTGPRKSSEEEARLDALRRRLYRADATDADRRRYAAERAAALQPEPAQEAAQDLPARPPGRPSLRSVAVVAVLLAGLAGVVVGERLDPRASGTARPSPSPVVQQDFGDGLRFAVDASGVSGPTRVATSVRGTAVVGQRFEGHGAAVVPVDLLPGSFDGGRAMVLLTAAQPAPTEWRALSVITRDDFSSFPVVMAQGTADPGTTVATPSTFVFSGGPPARIAVQAPADVRWTLVVAATSQIADELR